MNASAAKSLLTSQCNGNGNEKAMSASHILPKLRHSLGLGLGHQPKWPTPSGYENEAK